MLPRRLFKHFGWRVKLMKLALGYFYEWKPREEELTMAGTYRYCLVYTAISGAYFFIFVHIVQLYLKMYRNSEIPDVETPNVDGDSDKENGFAAEEVIAFGELMLVMTVIFLVQVNVERAELHMYLINQLIKYNTVLREMVAAGRMTLGPGHKIKAKLAEYIIEVVLMVSFLLPLGVFVVFLHPVEATHVLIKDWLEIELEVKVELLPLIIIILMAAYGCGTVTSLMMVSITLFWAISTVVTDGITPEAVDKDGGALSGNRRCRLVTRNFGVVEDVDIVNLFRTQQLQNILLNDFYKSLLVSFHHVGCLGAATCLICFVIAHHRILEGIGAYLLLFMCIWAIMALIFLQSRMCGEVADVSGEFRDKGRKLVGRRMLYHKFVGSCQTMFIQVAFPFYTINNETFLEFCGKVLDYVMTLLLW